VDVCCNFKFYIMARTIKYRRSFVQLRESYIHIDYNWIRSKYIGCELQVEGIVVQLCAWSKFDVKSFSEYNGHIFLNNFHFY